jgi:tetratricopeptide (TPR) repeat protein
MALDKNNDIGRIISVIQKFFLYILVIVLPISILPFPWDYTEKGMTLVILLFTLFILGLELIKIIWTGKIVFIKRDIDFILFVLLVSLVLTTIFASDSNLSLFGYNYRLSSGLIGISSTFFVAFVSRSFISNKKDFFGLVNALFTGSILASSISIITLLGGNIFELVPKIGNLGITGYPIVGAPVVLAIYNCVSIFLAYITLNIFSEKDSSNINDSSWFSIVVILVNIVSLLMVAVNPSAFYIIILFLVVWVLSLIVIFFKDSKMSSKSKIMQLVIPVLILIISILMQIESVRELIFGDKEIITPLKLSLNFSWQITSQSLTTSLRSAIVGLGLDNFGVAFTALKPIELVNVNFLSAYNEVLTFLSNGGFLWLIIWLVLGWYILRDLVKDLKDYKSQDRTLVLFDILVLFVYLTSFFTTYTILIRFLLFLLISLAVILRKLYREDQVDSFLFKVWAMGTVKQESKDTAVTPIFFSILISIVMLLGVVKIGSTVLSSLYLLRAESYIIEQNAKYAEESPTVDEQEAIVNNLYRWYQTALNYDKNNPLTNRKFSTVAVDRLSILMRMYEDSEDEEILNDAVNLRSQAFEYSRNAINLSPSLYSNYDNRVQVYFSVINMGYTEYVRDAIAVINEALAKNPYDYQNYYNKAQLYYYLQNYDLALESSNQALAIKGDYVEALILSANIYGIQGKTETQLNYLEALKTVLENGDLEESDLYGQLIEQIESISGQPVEDTTESEEAETEANPQEDQGGEEVVTEDTETVTNTEDVPETE